MSTTRKPPREPRIEVFPTLGQDSTGHCVRLAAANGAKLLTSEVYANKQSALRLARRLGDATGLTTFVLDENGKVLRELESHLQVVDVMVTP